MALLKLTQPFKFTATQQPVEIIMTNSNQTFCGANINPASDQCAHYLNNRDRKTLSALSVIVVAGIATTAFFLYHAVLNTSTLGGVPF